MIKELQKYLISGFLSNLAARNASKIRNISKEIMGGNLMPSFRDSLSNQWSYFNML